MWIEVKDQQDIDKLMESYGFFQDSCLRDLYMSTREFVDDQRVMHFNNTLTASDYDGYEGDLTSENRTRYKSEKPQGISMLFDPEFYSIGFQNYGNAMNSYTIFDELGNEKFIQLYKK